LIGNFGKTSQGGSSAINLDNRFQLIQNYIIVIASLSKAITREGEVEPDKEGIFLNYHIIVIRLSIIKV